MVGTPPGSHPPAQHGVANGGGGGGGGDDVGDRQQQDTPKVPARDVGAEALQLFRSLTLQGDQLQSQQQQKAALLDSLNRILVSWLIHTIPQCSTVGLGW